MNRPTPIGDRASAIVRQHTLYIRADTSRTRADEPPVSIYRGVDCTCGWSNHDVRQGARHLVEEALTETWKQAHREGYEAARADITSGAYAAGPNYEAVADSPVGRAIRAAVLREAASALPPGTDERDRLLDLI